MRHGLALYNWRACQDNTYSKCGVYMDTHERIFTQWMCDGERGPDVDDRIILTLRTTPRRSVHSVMMDIGQVIDQRRRWSGGNSSTSLPTAIHPDWRQCGRSTHMRLRDRPLWAMTTRLIHTRFRNIWRTVCFVMYFYDLICQLGIMYMGANNVYMFVVWCIWIKRKIVFCVLCII